MYFFRFMLLMLLSALAMRYIVLPVIVFAILKPIGAYSAKNGEGSRGLVVFDTVVTCTVNFAWILYACYVVRLYSHVSSGWLTPLYCLFGTGATLSIFGDKDGGTMRTVWAFIFWFVLLIFFICLHPWQWR